MTCRIRQARSSDRSALWPLAQQLNSYNLPADRWASPHLQAAIRRRGVDCLVNQVPPAAA